MMVIPDLRLYEALFEILSDNQCKGKFHANDPVS
jgi:hypothetical protein